MHIPEAGMLGRPVGTALALSFLLRPGRVVGQDASDSAAYRALTQTPVGAFAPRLGPAVSGERGRGAALSARYGLMSFRSNDYIHNFGLGFDAPLARGRLGVAAGHYGPACPRDDCPGHFMVSVDAGQSLAAIALGRRDNAANLTVGLDASVGYARPDATTLVSGGALVTFAMVPQGRGARLLPYIAPGVGVGLTHQDGDTDAGMLPMLALGVGFLGADDRLGVSAGATRVFLRGGNWVAGVSVGWAVNK
jgi:hypothetical protein